MEFWGILINDIFMVVCFRVKINPTLQVDLEVIGREMRRKRSMSPQFQQGLERGGRRSRVQMQLRNCHRVSNYLLVKVNRSAWVFQVSC